jgi:hypothetical protein
MVLWVGLRCNRSGYAVCYNILEYNDFYDSTINGAEMEATYENVMKAMDNQVVRAAWHAAQPRAVHVQYAPSSTCSTVYCMVWVHVWKVSCTHIWNSWLRAAEAC